MPSPGGLAFGAGYVFGPVIPGLFYLAGGTLAIVRTSKKHPSNTFVGIGALSLFAYNTYLFLDRSESRELQRVPRFNFNEAQTRDSMAVFEALASESGASVIIQHEPVDITTLPHYLSYRII